jgi:RNA polymerase sigma factor (sigma-70 family)
MLNSPNPLHAPPEVPENASAGKAPPIPSPESGRCLTCDLLRAQANRESKDGKEAFVRFIEPCGPILLSCVFSGISTHATEEDLLHETYLEAWKNLKGFDPARYTKPNPQDAGLAWMCGIARYVLLTHIRRNARRKETLGTDAFERVADPRRPAVDVIICDELAWVLAAANDMDERAPVIFQLRMAGDTHEEIAEHFRGHGEPEMTAANVRQIYNRTRRRLRERFSSHE